MFLLVLWKIEGLHVNVSNRALCIMKFTRGTSFFKTLGKAKSNIQAIYSSSRPNLIHLSVFIHFWYCIILNMYLLYLSEWEFAIVIRLISIHYYLLYMYVIENSIEQIKMRVQNKFQFVINYFRRVSHICGNNIFLKIRRMRIYKEMH